MWQMIGLSTLQHLELLNIESPIFRDQLNQTLIWTFGLDVVISMQHGVLVILECIQIGA